jgi:hypothetical protein
LRTLCRFQLFISAPFPFPHLVDDAIVRELGSGTPKRRFKGALDPPPAGTRAR